jgi:hypothetical protein
MGFVVTRRRELPPRTGRRVRPQHRPGARERTEDLRPDGPAAAEPDFEVRGHYLARAAAAQREFCARWRHPLRCAAARGAGRRRARRAGHVPGAQRVRGWGVRRLQCRCCRRNLPHPLRHVSCRGLQAGRVRSRARCEVTICNLICWQVLGRCYYEPSAAEGGWLPSGNDWP